MQEEKKSLEELTKEIGEAKELGDFYEQKELNKEDRIRCYFSRIKQYKLLVKKTQIELDNLFLKIDVQSGSAVNVFLARWGYYKTSIDELNERIKKYSNELKEYEEKYDYEFHEVLEGKLDLNFR